MLKKDAEQLVGKKVKVWTAANGEYVGILKEILPTKPWRGKVEITGVLKCACVYEIARITRPRHGFRCGDFIEAGNSSISATDEIGFSYLEALENEKKKFQTVLDRNKDEDGYVSLDKWTFFYPQAIKILIILIAEEKGERQKIRPLEGVV